MVTGEEYWRAYERAVSFYREIYKERFDEETQKKLKLKENILNSLIETRVLLIAAKNNGITVKGCLPATLSVDIDRLEEHDAIVKPKADAAQAPDQGKVEAPKKKGFWGKVLGIFKGKKEKGDETGDKKDPGGQ